MRQLRIILIAAMCSLMVSLHAQIKETKYQEWVRISFENLEKKDTLAAEQAFLNALRAEPGNPQNGMLLSNLGLLQQSRGMYNEALQSYNTALLFAPNSVVLHLNRAALLCEVDSISLALDDYTTAIALDDKSEEAYYQRGLIHLQMNDTLSAADDFKAILKIEPQSVKGRLGLAAWNKFVGAYAESERLYNIVQLATPKDANILVAKGELYLLWKKPSKALKEIDNALKMLPNDGLLYYMKGKALTDLYETKAAEDAFKEAKKLGYIE